MKRRDFVRSAGGATAALGAGATATAGTATAQEDGGGGGGGNQKPDFGDALSGAQGGEYQDLRGNSEVTIEVGGGSSGFAFLPTEVWIDTGTTVTFERVSGGHNVLPESQPSGASWSGHEPIEGEGFSFEFTFDTGGLYVYYCDPHRTQGMIGGIAVGSDVPTVAAGGGRKELHELGVPIQAHWVGSATILGIIVTVIFSFYVLKYGESPNTGTGRSR